jgi:hypothetical protein
MIIAHLGGENPQEHRPQGACPSNRSPNVSPAEPQGANPQPTAAALLGLEVAL